MTWEDAFMKIAIAFIPLTVLAVWGALTDNGEVDAIRDS